MREVDPTTFAARHRDGAVVIDVREQFEYVTGHVPGADLIPRFRYPAWSPSCPAAYPSA